MKYSKDIQHEQVYFCYFLSNVLLYYTFVQLIGVPLGNTLEQFIEWIFHESQHGLVKCVSVPVSQIHHGGCSEGFAAFATSATRYMAERQGIKYEVVYFPSAKAYVALRLSSTPRRTR